MEIRRYFSSIETAVFLRLFISLNFSYHYANYINTRLFTRSSLYVLRLVVDWKYIGVT